MNKNRKFFALAIIFATAFVLYQAFIGIPFSSLKDLFKNSSGTEIIQAINKEISNPGTLVAKIESSRSHLTKAGVFSFTNRERAENQIAFFVSDPKLDEVARLRLEDMFAKGYFEHVSPVGESASSVADDIGYEYISIGENIALGNFETDEILVQAWMDSPGHRANILNSRFTNLGVAVGKGVYQGRDTWIGVQIFSRPLYLCGSIDESLKKEIDLLILEADDLKLKIERVGRELEEMYPERRQRREEYNAKVEEYNALAREINNKNAQLKAMIERYNDGVRKFNACLGSE